jgi:hypothetical protein
MTTLPEFGASYTDADKDTRCALGFHVAPVREDKHRANWYCSHCKKGMGNAYFELREAYEQLLRRPNFSKAGLSNIPASPLPWKLQDNVIFDATGHSILGNDDGGLPIGFPCEFDADYIFQAAMTYIPGEKHD